MSNILLAITGSIASILVQKQVYTLLADGHFVKVIATESARKILQYYKVDYSEDLYTTLYDEDEWKYYKQYGTVLHIDLVKWADTVIVAPCTMNTLAKMDNGITDNLVTSVIRALSPEKQLIIAPAANVHMWENTITADHIKNIHKHYKQVEVIYPQHKTLYCGDVGNGAMANIDEIINAIRTHEIH